MELITSFCSLLIKMWFLMDATNLKQSKHYNFNWLKNNLPSTKFSNNIWIHLMRFICLLNSKLTSYVAFSIWSLRFKKLSKENLSQRANLSTTKKYLSCMNLIVKSKTSKRIFNLDQDVMEFPSYVNTHKFSMRANWNLAWSNMIENNFLLMWLI